MGTGAARGRPRDPEKDGQILAATVDLLAEVGFAGTTIAAVARRSGIRAANIYRRWPSRIALIANAVFPGFDNLVIEPTGDIANDLQRYVDAYEETFKQPAMRAAVPGLLSAYQSDPHQAVSLDVEGSIRESFRQMFQAAADGTVNPAVDPDDILDILIGAALFRAFVRPFSDRAQDSTYIRDLLIAAVRPDSA